eukprot:2632813-Pyramimonas_sp.AAC.1
MFACVVSAPKDAQTIGALVRSNSTMQDILYSMSVSLVAHDCPISVKLETTGGALRVLDHT